MIEALGLRASIACHLSIISFLHGRVRGGSAAAWPQAWGPHGGEGALHCQRGHLKHSGGLPLVDGICKGAQS